MRRWETVLVPLALTCSCQAYDRALYGVLTGSDASFDVAIDASESGVALDANTIDRAATTDASDVVALPDATPDVRDDIPADHVVDAPIDAPCTGHVVINELSAYDLSGDSFDEFVEIYNAGTCTASIGAWTLRSRYAANEPASVVWTAASSLSIRPGAYVVVGGTNYTGPVTSSFTGSTTGGASAIAHDGAIGLFNASGASVDSVAYDVTGGSLIERAPFPSANSPGQSLARRPNGNDTDDNANDFSVLVVPTPGAAN